MHRYIRVDSSTVVRVRHANNHDAPLHPCCAVFADDACLQLLDRKLAEFDDKWQTSEAERADGKLLQRHPRGLNGRRAVWKMTAPNWCGDPTNT